MTSPLTGDSSDKARRLQSKTLDSQVGHQLRTREYASQEQGTGEGGSAGEMMVVMVEVFMI